MADVEDLRPSTLEVPAEWQGAAEEIRAHLCLLRGGAPFLSPADTWQLVQWLESGVSPNAIVAALERAAHVRRAQRARTPLSLVAAKRHLGRPPPPSAVPRVAIPGEPPLAPLIRALRAARLAPYEADPMRLLFDTLAEATADDSGARRALAAARNFFEAVWNAAPEAARDAWRQRAREELADLLTLVPENLRGPLVEEGARDQLRQRHPALTAATIHNLLGLDGVGS